MYVLISDCIYLILNLLSILAPMVIVQFVASSNLIHSLNPFDKLKIERGN
jgi:hypothetical protein